jgi:hypothetical protein
MLKRCMKVYWGLLYNMDYSLWHGTVYEDDAVFEGLDVYTLDTIRSVAAQLKQSAMDYMSLENEVDKYIIEFYENQENMPEVSVKINGQIKHKFFMEKYNAC